MTERPLAGRVAIVTGASRGVGKGIAVGLGAAGATVYVTGRSMNPGDGPVVFNERLPGTVGDTAETIEQAGGKGIAVALDHRDDNAVEALFRRVDEEQGRLDILVNNAFLVPPELLSGLPFWEQPIRIWDDMTDVGVRSHFVCSVLGAQRMVRQNSGLIVNTSSPGGGRFSLTTAYGVGKAAVDRMTFDTAHELRPHNVAVVSIWLGLINPERTQVAARNVEQFDVSTAESPGFVGRGVAALAADPNVIRHSGEVIYSAELADLYGVREDEGRKPASLRPSWGDPPRYRA
ncbi:MAG: SDR family NAD(P)-dependent oxidoreductase [Hyphomicrobiales bacterium]